MGMDQHTAKQPGHCYPTAQDTPGFGKLGTAGIGDDVPTSGRQSSWRQAQDAGSVQGGFSPLGDHNKGTENFEGHVKIAGDLRAGTLTSDQVKPAPRLKFNDQAALNKNPWLMD